MDTFFRAAAIIGLLAGIVTIVGAIVRASTWIWNRVIPRKGLLPPSRLPTIVSEVITKVVHLSLVVLAVLGAFFVIEIVVVWGISPARSLSCLKQVAPQLASGLVFSFWRFSDHATVSPTCSLTAGEPVLAVTFNPKKDEQGGYGGVVFGFPLSSFSIPWLAKYFDSFREIVIRFKIKPRDAGFYLGMKEAGLRGSEIKVPIERENSDIAWHEGENGWVEARISMVKYDPVYLHPIENVSISFNNAWTGSQPIDLLIKSIEFLR